MNNLTVDEKNDIVGTEPANVEYKYTAEEIWTNSNSSNRTWDRFVANFLSAIGGDQKKEYLEEHPSILLAI